MGFHLVMFTLYRNLHAHLLCSPSKVDAAYCCNRHVSTAHVLLPGVHGLSNQLLNSPVKKLAQGKCKFTEIVSSLQNGALDQEEWFVKPSMAPYQTVGTCAITHAV